MKFIINTAVGSHFCALFDEHNRLIDSLQWDNFRFDGRNIYSFLEQNGSHALSLDFLGGVSGPGGFSSLRAGMCILNVLGFGYQCPVHTIRADHWISSALGHQNFFLNSFSDDIFYPQKGQLIHCNIHKAIEIFSDTPLFIDFLPPEKQALVHHTYKFSWENPLQDLLSVLQNQPPVREAKPEYEFQAV